MNTSEYIHTHTHTHMHLNESLVGCGEALQNPDESSEVQRVSVSFSLFL